MPKKQKKTDKRVAIWLFISAFMVFLMVVIGGLTRLTESGLSITEWEPIKGTLPPFNEADWQQLLNEYRESPQYKKINAGMTLTEFKNIFWLEYIHRLMGRITGFVFLLPLVYFFIKKKISRELTKKLIFIFALGFTQAVFGWMMVKSGLKDQPNVSPYKLALHLGTAFVILALILWAGFTEYLKKEKKDRTVKKAYSFSLFLSGIIFLQIILGAFVAGLDAGLTYNTYPLMDGKLIPDGLFIMSPPIINYFENVTMVQFNHRAVAIIVMISTFYFWHTIRRYSVPENVKFAAGLLSMFMVIQFVLGVKTLLFHVPVSLASLHQANAAIVFGIAIFINHRLRSKII